jgi:hypothetical protein
MLHNWINMIFRLAAEELLADAKRASQRAAVLGPSGWTKCTLPRTDTKFLSNTILHTVNSNRIREKSKKLHKRSGEWSNGSSNTTTGRSKKSDTTHFIRSPEHANARKNKRSPIYDESPHKKKQRMSSPVMEKTRRDASSNVYKKER